MMSFDVMPFGMHGHGFSVLEVDGKLFGGIVVIEYYMDLAIVKQFSLGRNVQTGHDLN